MARMQHPNILQVYDFDQLEIDGMELDYIVMEYVDGHTLEKELLHQSARMKTLSNTSMKRENQETEQTLWISC